MLMSSQERPASLHFGPNGFRVITAGSFVLCAVTGERVSLEELRYWSAELQEPYASAAVATGRLTGKN
jgi:hypothetical protein